MTKEEHSEMQRLRRELDTRFCRRCGYCEPCPKGVPILHLMDLMPLIKNMPPQFVFSAEIASELEKAANCTKCGECEPRCSYGLPIIELIEEHFSLYQAEKRKYQEQRASG